MEHKFYIDGSEFTVRLVHSDYEGHINQLYAFVFHIKESDDKKLKVIRIEVTDRVIDMWNDVGGSKKILEDKEIFAWQLVPHFLPQLLSKDKLKVNIHLTDEIKKEDDVIYIKASSTISSTARAIIFSGEKPTNNLIRREVLKVCFNFWQNEPHGFVNRNELLKFIPVSEIELERNLSYLVDSHFIKGGLTSGGYLNVRITTQGIDIFENQMEFERRFSLKPEQQTVNVGGDMITTILVGNENQNIVKSATEEILVNKK